MRIAAIYSFNQGKEEAVRRYADLIVEVNDIIKQVVAADHKTKESTEKTMAGRVLFSPTSLNKAFKKAFASHGGWKT
ncbi:MAG: restriction endonuclease, partial [Bacteroidota bacterium]